MLHDEHSSSSSAGAELDLEQLLLTRSQNMVVQQASPTAEMRCSVPLGWWNACVAYSSSNRCCLTNCWAFRAVRSWSVWNGICWAKLVGNVAAVQGLNSSPSREFNCLRLNESAT